MQQQKLGVSFRKNKLKHAAVRVSLWVEYDLKDTLLFYVVLAAQMVIKAYKLWYNEG